jgi:DNA mismatch endonuclease (patch repair protein)
LSYKPGAKYCSRACFFAGRKTGETVLCASCGKQVYLERGRVNRGTSKNYCSKTCHDAHQSKKVEVSCKTCSKPFLVSPSAVGRGRKYCSIPCRDACPDFKRDCWIENNIKLQRGAPTRLELVGRSILLSSGVEFEEQVLIAGKFTVDAFIEKSNVVVQWDGNYWHGYRAANDNRPLSDRQLRRVALDRSQDAYMAKAGYKVLRFWEHEVFESPSDVQSRVLAACRINLSQNF